MGLNKLHAQVQRISQLSNLKSTSTLRNLKAE